MPCKPKTLKMSAYGFVFPLLRDPKGLANTVGAAHTRVRHVAGVQGKTSKGQAATRLLRKP